MTVATQSSWKRLPFPERKHPLRFSALYADVDAERMLQGFIPWQMEDKWFIYFHEGWLYFLRSWTGACIYAIRLDGSPAGVRVTDSWVNRDSQQYKGDDDEYDREFVGFLVDALLLRKPAQFPRPADQSEPKPGAIQHHMVGLAYPEVVHHKVGFWRKLFVGIRKRKGA
jgi:hypothetical protein